MDDSDEADRLVRILGWEPLVFFDELPRASVATMEELLRILAPRCGNSYFDMLGDGAILGIIDEAIARATRAGEWP